MMNPRAVSAKAGKAAEPDWFIPTGVFDARKPSFRQEDLERSGRDAGLRRRCQSLIFGGQEEQVGAFLGGGNARAGAEFGREDKWVLRIHSRKCFPASPIPRGGLPEMLDQAAGAIVISTLPA